MMQDELKLVKSAIVAKLDRNVRWKVNGTPVDFDFSVAYDEPSSLPAWAHDQIYAEFEGL